MEVLLKEVRSYPAEIRKDANDKKFEGHSAVFDSLSEDLGGFREKIKPGAFLQTIKADDIRALFNHDTNYVLGRSTSGTLSLAEDGQGLKVMINPPDTQWAKDLMRSVERGDISQMSFAFRVLEDDWDEKGNFPTRTLLKVKLYDVSIVTYPAYPQTDIKVRSTSDIFREFIEHKNAAKHEEENNLMLARKKNIRAALLIMQTKIIKEKAKC